MTKGKSTRIKDHNHPTNPKDDGALAGLSPYGWAAVPVAGITAWGNVNRALAVAALLCFIAVIALAVPAIFDYWRRWRQARQMSDLLRTNTQTNQPSTSRQVEPATPMQNAPQTPLGWSSEEELPTATPAPNRRKTILIADDDPVVVLAISRRLQHLGYTVLRSPDAMHALMGAMKAKPDLMILDIKMPSGNGLAVCEMMASDPQYADIPVIVHSMISDDETKNRCRWLGAHYVEKSSNSWKQIRELVESLLASPKTPEKPRVSDPWKSLKPTAGILAKDAETDAANVVAEDSVEETKQAEPNEAAPPPAPAVQRTSNRKGPPRVICIESPKDRLEFVERQLSGLGMEVVRTDDLEQGFWMCFTDSPNAVVVQAAAGGQSVSKLRKDLATHPVTRSLPVLWIDESQTMDEGRMPDAPNILVLKYPMDWETFLVELEEMLPEFGRQWTENFGQPASPASEQKPAVVAVDHKPLRILCVDDDPVLARSIVMHLRPYGMQVETAENGTQGYLMATSGQPDLILLDLMMPQGDGNYVLGKLKDNPRTRQIPVVVLTIEASPATRRRMFSLGADAFVGKPIDWEKLYTEMGRCVQLPEKLLAEYNLPEQLTIQQL